MRSAADDDFAFACVFRLDDWWFFVYMTMTVIVVGDDEWWRVVYKRSGMFCFVVKLAAYSEIEIVFNVKIV